MVIIDFCQKNSNNLLIYRIAHKKVEHMYIM